jgi:DNA-binding CsgD family transcriptional regulator
MSRKLRCRPGIVKVLTVRRCPTITRWCEKMDGVNFVTQEEAALNRALVALYAAEPDLHRLPSAVFDGIAATMPVQMISYGEFHAASNDFRVAFSQVDPDPQRRASTLAAYQRLAGSHPFWQYDPAFYGERALRESDFFDDEEFFALPIAKEVFLPAGAHRQMRVVVGFDGYVLHVTAHRVVGEPPFSDAERDRMQVLRGHIVRIYRQALERTATTLTPAERLDFHSPGLSRRQRDVALLLAAGKSNEAIARALNISLDTVKSHLRAVYAKLGVDDRFGAGLAIHRRPPFARMPPMWSLPGSHWAPDGTIHVEE